MDDIGTRDPALSNTTERLNDSTLRPVLDELGNVVLDRRRVWEPEMIPNEEQEVPEVVKTGVYLCQAASASRSNGKDFARLANGSEC